MTNSFLFCHGYTNYNVGKGWGGPQHMTNSCIFCLPSFSSCHLSCFSPSLHPVAFNHTACALNVDTTCLTMHKIRTICSSQLEHADKCSIKDTASTLKKQISRNPGLRSLGTPFLPPSCTLFTSPLPLPHLLINN